MQPNSNLTSYATASDLVARVDVNVVCQLLSDTNIPVPISSLGTNQTLTALLQEASGMVEASAMEGGRYAATDLAGLNGNSQQLLIGMVVGLTAWLAWTRRQDLGLKLPIRAEMAVKMLEDLRTGKVVFATVEAEQAGQVQINVESPIERVYRNGPVQQARRLFGRRAKDYPSQRDNTST